MNLNDYWKDMRADTLGWTRHALPRVLVVLVVAFILIRLLRAATRRLDKFSQNISAGERAHQMHQLRTLAQVINSVGVAIIFFLAAMQILPLVGLDIKPLLASAGIAGLAELGEFSLRPQEGDVRAVFVALKRLQRDLDVAGRVNTLLVSDRTGGPTGSALRTSRPRPVDPASGGSVGPALQEILRRRPPAEALAVLHLPPDAPLDAD